MRVLLYAINGVGLGHVTRLAALGRALRALAEAGDIDMEVSLLTTSEAPRLPADLPTYKLPSKTVTQRAGFDRQRQAAVSKVLISNLVATLAPDLLVLDTQPQGAFSELAFLRGYARSTAFVYRHVDGRVADGPAFQSHLALYDRVLVPDFEGEAERYPMSSAVRQRTRFIGPVHGYRPAEAWDRARVRLHFNVPPQRKLVYLAAGGGGDNADLHHLLAASSRDPSLHLLVGYGPLHQGSQRYGERVTPLMESEVWRYFPGVDAAISAAGYNTYQELLAAGVPTLFFAQPRGLDRQDERVSLGVRAGWHGELGAGPDVPVQALALELVLQQLQQLLQDPQRQQMMAALERRPVGRGAERGAAELLGLLASLPRSGLARARVHELALYRSAQATADISAEEFAEAVRWMSRWRRLTQSSAEVDDWRERCTRAWLDPSAEERERATLQADLRWGRELLRWQGRFERSAESWLDFLRAWRSGLPTLAETELRQRLADDLRAFEGGRVGSVAAELTQLEQAYARSEIAAGLQRLAMKRDDEQAVETDTPRKGADEHAHEG